MTRLIFPTIAILSSLFYVACKPLVESSMAGEVVAVFEVIDLDAVQAAELLEIEDVTILDVRTPDEFAVARISGAINYNVHARGFEEALKSIDLSKPLLVHCAAGLPGGRSRFAIDFLSAVGAGKVYHLDGGLIGWKDAGYPVEK